MSGILVLAFLAGLVALAIVRPWLMTIAYIYVDLIQPQRLGYAFLERVPINLYMAVAAVIFFLFDKKKNLRFNIVQFLMLTFIGWFTLTSTWALAYDEAVWFKWDSAWKSVGFGVFLPLVLSTRRRMEVSVAVLVLCISLVIVSAGIKTLVGGGGYENLPMIVQTNRGIYESSTASTLAVALIPLTAYLYRRSPLVPKTWLMKATALGMVACALLVLVGTEARTGLVCLAALAAMMFWTSRRKAAIAAGAVALGIVALPFLPQSFVDRMATITRPDEDPSASARTEVWKWTIGFVQEQPLGGGFGVWRLNQIEMKIARRAEDGTLLSFDTITQRGRAFHSSYFEVLGEHGFPGLFLYLSIIGATLWQLMAVRRRFAEPGERRWLADLSIALGRAIVVYAVGGLTVGLAFQTTLYLFIALGIALCQYAAVLRAAEARRPEIARPFGRPATLAHNY